MPNNGNRKRRLRRRAQRKTQVAVSPSMATRVVAPAAIPAPIPAEPKRPGRVLFQHGAVQRLRRSTRTDKPGFLKAFYPEDMGAAEFEFGAFGDNLKMMRAAGELIVLASPVTRLGCTQMVFFVGPAAKMDDKVAEFKRWFAGDFYTKEPTYFERMFDIGSGPLGSKPTVAWWLYDHNLAWTLDPDTAFDLLDAFNMPPVP